MAGQRLTDKTALAENTASDDKLMVVDTSDTTGSSAGTSKKIDSKFVIQTDKISLNNAEVIALDDGGGAGEFKVLVAAPGSGFMIQVLQVSMITTGAGAAETSNKNLYFGYDVDQTTSYFAYYNRFVNLLTSGQIRSFMGNGNTGNNSNGSAIATIDNTAFSVWSNGTFVGGWAMDVFVTYQIVKL
jgi:hypothetical protein